MSQDKKNEEKKPLLNLDKLGDGLMAMEGNPSTTVWENAYKKPEFIDFENNGKSTHIVVNKKQLIPTILVVSKNITKK